MRGSKNVIARRGDEAGKSGLSKGYEQDNQGLDGG